VQGSCAQIFKIALIKIDQILDPKIESILLPVHDEFQIELRKSSSRDERNFVVFIISAMINIPQLDDRGLKLRVDVSKTTTNWAKKEKLEV